MKAKSLLIDYFVKYLQGSDVTPILLYNKLYIYTSKGTCPVKQAGACSIQSHLRRSNSALLIHYKSLTKENIGFNGNCTHTL